MLIVLLLYVLPIIFIIYSRLGGTLQLGKVNTISIILFFYFFLTTLIGAVLIHFGFGNNPVLRLTSEKIKVVGVYIVLYTIFAFALGLTIAKYLHGIKSVRKTYTIFLEKTIEESNIKDSSVLIVLDLFFVVLLFSAVYVTYITGFIPQLKLMSAVDHAAVLLFRVESSREFSGIIYIKTIFFEKMIPIQCLLYYAYFMKKKTKMNKFRFFISFCLATYSLTFSLAKSPFITFLIILFIETIYIKGGISLKKFFKIMAFILVLLFVFFMLITKDSFIGVLQYLINRIFVDQVSGMYLMLEMFPKKNDFLGLSSISRLLSSSFGVSFSEPATRLAMEYAFPAATARGEMNLLSTFFMGEAWANFGLWGCLLAPIYVGFLYGNVFYYFIKNNKTPFAVAFLAYMSFGLNITAQFNSYVYNMLFWIILFLLGFIYFMAYIIQIACDKWR